MPARFQFEVAPNPAGRGKVQARGVSAQMAAEIGVTA